MAYIIKSDEVYKHIKGKHKIVPVQGVYVTGEHRPPYYNEAGVHILSLSTQPATVNDFKDVTLVQSDAVVKLVDFYAIPGSPTLTFYTTATADAGNDTITKLVDFYAVPSNPTFLFYSKQDVDAGNDTITKLVDFYAVPIPISQPTVYHSVEDDATPGEPILQLTGFSTEPCEVTNISP